MVSKPPFAYNARLEFLKRPLSRRILCTDEEIIMDGCGVSSMEKKIMIVDDQKGIRLLLAELFSREGWEVLTVANGKEALEKLSCFLPAILLIDMRMPDMNGIEVSREMLRKQQELIIIMITAYEEMDIIEEALAAGVKKCIIKPFDILALRAEVNSLFAEKYAEKYNE